MAPAQGDEPCASGLKQSSRARPGIPSRTIPAPPALRDKASGALLELVMRELFEFGFMQTDPNFANFKWRHEERTQIVLLDFGGARPVPSCPSRPPRPTAISCARG